MSLSDCKEDKKIQQYQPTWTSQLQLKSQTLSPKASAEVFPEKIEGCTNRESSIRWCEEGYSTNNEVARIRPMHLYESPPQPASCAKSQLVQSSADTAIVRSEPIVASMPIAEMFKPLDTQAEGNLTGTRTNRTQCLSGVSVPSVSTWSKPGTIFEQWIVPPNNNWYLLRYLYRRSKISFLTPSSKTTTLRFVYKPTSLPDESYNVRLCGLLSTIPWTGIQLLKQ
jgi:hypothetical protein